MRLAVIVNHSMAMHPNTEMAYRRLSQQLQTDFYKHYNLLHRLNIRERIECMKGSM